MGIIKTLPVQMGLCFVETAVAVAVADSTSCPQAVAAAVMDREHTCVSISTAHIHLPIK